MREKGVDIAGILDSNQELFQSQMEYTSLDGYEAWICDYCDLLLRLSLIHISMAEKRTFILTAICTTMTGRIQPAAWLRYMAFMDLIMNPG